MKKLLVLMLVGSLNLVLVSCLPSNRFEDKNMDYYIQEYKMTEVVFNKATSLETLGYELYYTGYSDELYNDYVNPKYSTEWALGKINGAYKILFVPTRDDFDIFVLDSPFPDFEIILENVVEYNQSDNACEINIASGLEDYDQFESLYDENSSIIFHEYFDHREVDSSLTAEIGTCEIEDETYVVRLVAHSNRVYVIAHSSLRNDSARDATVIELFVID